jgi:hypothetical protein
LLYGVFLAVVIEAVVLFGTPSDHPDYMTTLWLLGMIAGVGVVTWVVMRRAVAVAAVKSGKSRNAPAATVRRTPGPVKYGAAGLVFATILVMVIPGTSTQRRWKSRPALRISRQVRCPRAWGTYNKPPARTVSTPSTGKIWPRYTWSWRARVPSRVSRATRRAATPLERSIRRECRRWVATSCSSSRFCRSARHVH